MDSMTARTLLGKKNLALALMDQLIAEVQVKYSGTESSAQRDAYRVKGELATSKAAVNNQQLKLEADARGMAIKDLVDSISKKYLAWQLAVSTAEIARVKYKLELNDASTVEAVEQIIEQLQKEFSLI